MSEKKTNKKRRNVKGFIVTFILAFVIVYTALGFVPNWRVAPASSDTAIQYLIKSWKYMIPIKAAISAVASVLLGLLFTH